MPLTLFSTAHVVRSANAQATGLLSALLLVLIGGGVVFAGFRYGVGTLRDMGAGFMPVVFGSLIALVGILIGLVEGRANLVGDDPRSSVDLRGAVFILAGTLSFVLLSSSAGLVPAVFACVFLSALGDRTNSLTDAILLAGACALVCGVGFGFLLNLGLPLFWWS